MTETDVQVLCAAGQKHLTGMNYIQAEHDLALAGLGALARKDWDALSRLYMPLQEARRQRRQRAAEGIVKLDFLARSPSDEIDLDAIKRKYAHGQLLVAAWNDPAPARQLRDFAIKSNLYLDVFVASVEMHLGALVVMIHADDASTHLIPLPVDALPTGEQQGSDETFAQTMKLWETLHAPFLARADAQIDPIKKITGYLSTIEVDYACELAHQNLSLTARRLAQTL